MALQKQFYQSRAIQNGALHRLIDRMSKPSSFIGEDGCSHFKSCTDCTFIVCVDDIPISLKGRAVHMKRNVRIIELRNSGLTAVAIAKRVGLSSRAVYKVLQVPGQAEQLVREFNVATTQRPVDRHQPRIVFEPTLYYNSCGKCGTGAVKLDQDVELGVNTLTCISCGWSPEAETLTIEEPQKLL